ncbi:MAG: hypothetical protein N4A45_06290, partial [Flavobacteriales bacterium]|nr:hypothetical protein [Flavobacteriales bacterium]
MRNAYLIRRLKILVILVFSSMISNDLLAQDTLQVVYRQSFERGQEYCGTTPQYDSWTKTIDSLRTLQDAGVYGFVKVEFKAVTATDSVSFMASTASDVQQIVTQITDTATTAADNNVLIGGKLWHFDRNCSPLGTPSAGCLGVDVALRSTLAIDITDPILSGCSPQAEFAIRPHSRVKAWGGAFGTDMLGTNPIPSASANGPDEELVMIVSYVDIKPPIPVCMDTFDIYIGNSGTEPIDQVKIDSMIKKSFDEFLNPGLLAGNAADSGWGIHTATSNIASMNCDSVGKTPTATITLMDIAGNDTTCGVVLRVLDTIPPQAIAKDTIRLYLAADTTAYIDVATMDDGSIDNCTSAGFTRIISDTLFTCPGEYKDTLWVSDGFDKSQFVVVGTDTVWGNYAFDVTTIIVLDTVPPDAIITAGVDTFYLDSMGSVTIVADSFNNNSGDNDTCGTLTFTLADSVYDCMEVGDQSTQFYATDASGNVDSVTLNIHIKDTLAPVAVLRPLIIASLDSFGVFVLDSAQVDSASFDNCSLVSLTLDMDTFTCSHTGMTGPGSVPDTHTVIVTLTDTNSNITTDSIRIVVKDTLAPVMEVLAVDTVYLDNTGNFTYPTAVLISPMDSMAYPDYIYDIIDTANSVSWSNGNRYDNCMITPNFPALPPPAPAIDQGITIKNLSFDCSDIGSLVQDSIFFRDNSGNTSKHGFKVLVLDTFAPNPMVLAVDTVFLDANGAAGVDSNAFDNGSTDNCAVGSFSLSVDSFFCASADSTIKVFTTVMDTNGNSAIDSTMVTVLDTVAPEVMLSFIDTVYLNADGFVLLDSNTMDSASMDNCTIASFELSIDSFACDALNATNDSLIPVQTKVTDLSGNADSATAFIMVRDTLAPVVECVTDTFVHLNANGFALIDSSFLFRSITDNCPANLTFTVSEDTLFCSDLDSLNVTLTVADDFGNTSTCVVNVKVIDTIAPVAMAKNATAYLDTNGILKLDSAFLWSQVNNGSSDNCDFDLFAVDSIFDCSKEGLNIVTLIARDKSGNEGTAEFFLTVDDTIKPTAIGKNIIAVLNDNGTVSIDPSQVDSASFDNCMDNLTFDLSQTNFDCSHVGTAQMVDFIVNDGNGQTDTAQITVTVLDKTVPTAIAQNITVYLDAMGNVAITAAQVNNNSMDICGIDTMFISKDSLNCANIGTNPVSLTVVDHSGNTNSANAIVTVMDTFGPVVHVTPGTVEVFLDQTGHVVINSSNVVDSVVDNCGGSSSSATLDIDVTDLTCSSLGMQTITITATDQGGNVTTTTKMVEVKDTIAPVLIAKDTFFVDLGSNGIANVDAEDLVVTTSDNCSQVDSLVFGYDGTFNGMVDCSDVSTPKTVKLNITDLSGNTALSNDVVIVTKDVTAPTISSTSISTTVQLNASGMGTVDTSNFGLQNMDACGIASQMLNKTSFDCSNVGN